MKKMKKILNLIIMLIFVASLGGGLVFATSEEGGGIVDVRENGASDESKRFDGIFIKAINPGYTVDGKSNVGEMIEIGKKIKEDDVGDGEISDEKILLAGLTIGYTNSSGNYATLFTFPENSYLAGESIILRLASASLGNDAAGVYTKTLAFKGGIDLKFNDIVIDTVCWTGKDECYEEFKTGEMTALVKNLETGKFEKVKDYAPKYDEKSYEVLESGMGGEEMEQVSHCTGVIFSEILSYYDLDKSEQFIELYNSAAEQVLLDGCKIRYKNILYELSGIIKAEGYFAYYPTEFNLTKNPTNSNILELVEADGRVVDKLEYFNGQKKGTSYMMVGYDAEGKEIWRTTYAVTPGEANNFQEYRSCEEGKVLNEETGNCVKATEVKTVVCGEGQYLNPLTGRCKKYEEEKVTICKEGYYYNEDTGKCRKITINNGAEYDLEPESYEEKSGFVGIIAIIIVVVLGLAYVIYEFRMEILGFIKKIFKKK